MISVIVQTHNAAASLPACLAALVPAAVDALVREVIVVDAGSADATLDIAEDSGAKLAPSIDEALAMARADWVMLLSPLARLERGWEAEVKLHIDRYPGKAACFRLAWEDRGLGPRLREALTALGGPRAEQGLLIERARYGRHGPMRRLNAKAFIL